MSGPDGCIPVPQNERNPAFFHGDVVSVERANRIGFLMDSRPKLIDYLKMKLDAEDWHGCQDAASDLRDLDSELDGLRY